MTRTERIDRIMDTLKTENIGEGVRRYTVYPERVDSDAEPRIQLVTDGGMTSRIWYMDWMRDLIGQVLDQADKYRRAGTVTAHRLADDCTVDMSD